MATGQFSESDGQEGEGTFTTKVDDEQLAYVAFSFPWRPFSQRIPPALDQGGFLMKIHGLERKHHRYVKQALLPDDVLPSGAKLKLDPVLTQLESQKANVLPLRTCFHFRCFLGQLLVMAELGVAS